MRQPNFRRRLQIVAQTADPARTVRASCIARSTMMYTRGAILIEGDRVLKGDPEAAFPKSEALQHREAHVARAAEDYEGQESGCREIGKWYITAG